MGTVKQVFTGDIKQLEQAYDQLTRQNLRLEQQVTKLAMESERGSQTAGRGMMDLNRITGQSIQQVANLAVQYVGFTAILRGVNAELEEMKRLQEGSRDTQISVANSQAEVIKNMTGVSSADRQRFLKQLGTISFPKQQQINLAAAAGLSAGGDPRAVADAVRQSARVSVNKPEDLPTISGGALFIANATGSIDARRNLGFMLSAGEKSPIVGMESQARNLASAVGSMVGTVAPDKSDTVAEREQAAIESGALFAALGRVAVDPRGEATRTSSISFSVQLRDFFEKGVEVGSGRRKIRIKPPEDPGTLAGRVRVLQEDEKLRKQFLEKASFEQQFKVPIEKLFTGGETAEAFRENLQNIRFDEGMFDQVVRDLNTLTPELEHAARQREADETVQRHELADTAGGSAATAREIRDKALARTRLGSVMPAGTRMGIDWLTSQMNEFLGDDPEKEAISRLRRRQSEIRLERLRFGHGPERSMDKLSIDERRDFDYLAEQIKILERMEATQQKLLEEQRKTNERKPSATAPANAERGGQTER